jgi:hypothetical protein
MLRPDSATRHPTKQLQGADGLPAEKARSCRWARWNDENAAAIRTYNERIERDGLPLAKYRSFASGPDESVPRVGAIE